jgi:hypothetical protein
VGIHGAARERSDLFALLLGTNATHHGRSTELTTSIFARTAIAAALLTGTLGMGASLFRSGQPRAASIVRVMTEVPADERAPSPWVPLSANAPGASESTLPPTPGFFAPPEELLAQSRECTGESPDRFYEFYFTRGIYNQGGGGFFGRRGGGGSWATDYPKADCQFITVIKRLAGLDIYYDSNAIALDDPNLRRYPFLYMLEVGRLDLSESEATGLRSYLDAGGFLVIDDFWGTYEWAGFERGIRRVFPDEPIVEIPLDHDLFKAFYTIDKIVQVPNVRNAEAVARGFGVTYEDDGVVPHVRGIFGDDGRLLVLINWNTDMGDAWEWAEDPLYPLEFSTFAFEMGVNMILYSMTH